MKKEDIITMVQEPLLSYQASSPLAIILGEAYPPKSNQDRDHLLIALSRNGVKKSSLKSLAAFLGVTMEEVSDMLHTSYRNIQRKDDDELFDSLKSARILSLASFVQRGIEVLGSRHSFTEWLHSPLPVLQDKRPVEYLDTDFGVDVLSRILGRLEHGVFS